MPRDLFSRYIWLIDTIKRHGRITREQINEQWMRSAQGDGNPINRRTFYNYRQAVEELFNINIECDPATYEYYISQTEQQQSVTNWLLNSATTNNMLASSRDIADRIFLEDVPSAREHLPAVIEAIREGVQIKLDYHPYTRSLPTRGIVLEPYFTKLFKQRWYVVGRNVKEDKIKTYALDRVLNVQQLGQKFSMPADFDPAEYFSHAFGIVVDQSEPRLIRIRTDLMQAKYFRALPLHSSQEEMVHDTFSIFQYRMRPTRDLVDELLRYGSHVEVLEPKELRAMVKLELEKALDQYKS